MRYNRFHITPWDEKDGETVDDLLIGYLSPYARGSLRRYPCEFRTAHVPDLLHSLRYFRVMVVPKFLDKLTWEYPDDRVREQAQAVLLEIAGRIDPDSDYLEKRKKYRKTFNVSGMYHRSQELTRVWLSGKYSMGVRLLTATYYRQFSPEARKFVAHRLAQIAELIGT